MALNLLPDDKIVPAFGVKPDHEAEPHYRQALVYLSKSNSARELIRKLREDEKKFYVMVSREMNSMFVHEEIAKDSGFDGGVIVWNPGLEFGTITAMRQDNATLQSPAMGLAHEMGHAVQWLERREYYVSTAAKAIYHKDVDAKLEIENDNITRHETPVAQELDEGTRKDYNSGAPFGKLKENYNCPYSLLPLVDGDRG